MDLLDNSFLSFAVFLFITFVPFLFVLALIVVAIRLLWYHAKD
jgi:Ca2+/Na+ antiporter